MKLLAIFLVIFSVVAVFNAKVILKDENLSPRSTIGCEYVLEDEIYMCILNIDNPEGLDNFESIEGEHQSGLTNDDVVMVYASGQNTPIPPRIICESFPNLAAYYLESSNVRDITPNSFQSCRNLQSLYLNNNALATIPNRAFASNSNLQTLILSQNNINLIQPVAFEGLQLLNFLDLSYNQLNSFDRNAFLPLQGSLDTLMLHQNQIVVLPDFAFSGFSSLSFLDIGFNPLMEIPGNFLSGLSNLLSLAMDGLNIRELNPEWFASTSNLAGLYLYRNAIRSLPIGIFNNLAGLRVLGLENNELAFIHSNAFGPSINSLMSLYLSFNQIQAFDQDFVNNVQQLNYLNLVSNECVDENFQSIPGNREEVVNALSTCITNFIGSANCAFSETGYGYFCNLAIENIAGNDFEEIGGEHLEGRTNEDVVVVQALFQNTRNIPARICQQFPNIEDLFIQQSEVEIISEESFVNCANLYHVSFDQNRIRVIPDNTFRNNPRLERFYAISNEINHISASAFEGTILREIYMADNQLPTFDPRPFEAVGQTLTELFLYGNRMSEIPEEAFSNFPFLDYLDLDENPFLRIPPNAFRGLFRLTHLSLEWCNIWEVHPQWLFDLPALNDLRLDHNNIDRLPPGLFNSNRDLWVLSLGDNRIRNLNSNVFGASLQSLRQIYVHSNGIRAVDNQILTAPILTSFNMENNLCVNEFFVNVQGNLQQIEEELSECFRFFDGFMNCEYGLAGDFYYCMMSIHNVQPRDNFYNIDGAHLEGQANGDVRVVEVIDQETYNIPKLICAQFYNLEQLMVDESYVEFINEDAFEFCQRLEWLYLYGNNIRVVPDFTFANSPRLQEVYLTANRIDRIAPNAFRQNFNTSIRMLDLSQNEIVQLDRRWLQPLGESLTQLFLSYNRIQTIQESTFEGFDRLELLNLYINAITAIPSRAFAPLVNLRTLYLGMNQLTRISPQWFATLFQLVFFSAYGNQIEDIPAFTFQHQPNIREVDFGMNNLRLLHSDILGPAATSLRYFIADVNQIEFIEEGFFDQMENLNILNLRGNQCINDNLQNIEGDRANIRSQLQGCFDNANRAVPINCMFYENINGQYACLLESEANLSGNDNTEVIGGDHLIERTHEDVESVDVNYLNIRSIPSAICRQFPNLRTLSIQGSGFQTIRETALSSCLNLETFLMEFAPINILTPGIFANNAALTTIRIRAGQIYRILPGAFAGAPVSFLDLGINNLIALDPAIFNGVSNTINRLFLYYNRFTSLPENAFSSLTNLQELDLGLNFDLVLTPNQFEGLSNINWLALDGLAINQLHPQWFTSLPNLRSLFIEFNNIRNFPENIFEPLEQLQILGIGENPIGFLGAESFGSNPLNNLENLNLELAQLHALDEEIFNRATNLRMLYLSENDCFSGSIYNVNDQREETRELLQDCFRNFVGELSCQYAQDGDNRYMCDLLINNIAGQNAFTSVPGDHIGSNTNTDVQRIEAIGQRSRNVPSILCSTFTNAAEIFLTNNGIEILDENSFAGCTMLDRLTLAYNRIHTLPDNLFQTNENLVWASFYENEIATIGENALTGSRLNFIELDNNRLRIFNPLWFEPVNTTLETIDLRRNGMIEVPENAFVNLRQTRVLDLGYNMNIRIPPHTFNPLENIREIHLNELGLRSLDFEWFQSTTTLESLSFDNNFIRNLQYDIFQNLPNIQSLSLRRNYIYTISGIAFGYTSTSLRYLFAEYNRINEFDIDLFRQWEDLQSVFMRGNVCLDDNLSGISVNREGASEALWRCFDNYGIWGEDKE